MISIELSGKTAIVTGGSRGIGKAICLLLGEAGADVMVCCHKNTEAAAEVAERIQQFGSRAVTYTGDIRDRKVCEGIFSTAQKQLGEVDILVANAGVWKYGPIDELSEQQWDETLETNLTSIFNLCQFASRVMKSRKTGRIILIGSTAGQRGEAFHSHYAASKGAIHSFTKSLAAELGPHNIRVNTVAPGWVDTDMSAEILKQPELAEAIVKLIPLGRVATAEEVAGPVLFLASEFSNHIQGEIVNVNGGSVLCG